MKRVFGILLLGSFLMVSCSKKTRPSKSVPPKRPEHTAITTPSRTEPPVTNIPPPVTDSPLTNTTTVVMAPMIVIDEKGKVITTRDKLPPDFTGRVDYAKISRGFTPAQRQNLIYRFKMVPPRVLFVPDQLASRSAKGTYVVYRKKFWYWKKEDGLFHLDETYYQ